jgi:hypothetical protein
VSSDEQAESDIIPMTTVMARKPEILFEKKVVRENFILSVLIESPNEMALARRCLKSRALYSEETGERPD